MKTTLIGLLIGIIIGGIGFYLLNTFSIKNMTAQENSLAANTTTVTQSTSTKTTTLGSTAPTFSWELKDVTKTTDTNTSTQVNLIAGGKSHVLGTYQGNCKVIAANETGVLGEKADADELSPRVQCWFAGGGDEIGLFKDGAGYSVKVGQLEEGIEGGMAFRGNFKTTIPL